jgi:hypothetical protein
LQASTKHVPPWAETTGNGTIPQISGWGLKCHIPQYFRGAKDDFQCIFNAWLFLQEISAIELKLGRPRGGLFGALLAITLAACKIKV